MEEPELLDTMAAIHAWTVDFDFTIRLLNSVPCDARLSRHVCALLREYRLVKFLSLNGNYHILFKDIWILSSIVRERYSMLRAHWEEVICFHKAAIAIANASNLSQQGQSSLLMDAILEENKALCEMERNLKRAVSQENSKSHGWQRDYENEATYFMKLKLNPIWTQFYNYDSYALNNE